MRRNQAVQTAVAAALLGITIITGGCSSERTSEHPVAIPVTPNPTMPASGTHTGPPTPNSSTPSGGGTGLIAPDPTTTPGNGSNSNQGQQQQVATSSDQPAAEGKDAQPPIQPYTVNKPALKGIRINDNVAAVTQLAGKPLDEYFMDDEVEPIQIYEYNGYLIGFNKFGKVQFVEITSKDVETGLNGFRLGSNVKEAQKALGKPDMNTKYAVSYKNDGTVLKLDVDPVTQNCLSIKLFAESK